MSQVRRPPDQAPPQRARPAPGPQQPQRAPAGGVTMRERVSSYAFGVLLIGAVGVAFATWMGGSLGAVTRQVDSSADNFVKSLGFRISRIEIVGLDPETEPRLRSALSVTEGDSMLRADPGAIKAAVEKLDAVGAVSVHRMWPDQVTILAQPRVPMALWQHEGDWRVIDQRGDVFAEVAPDEFLNLPRIVGTGGDAAAPRILSALVEYPQLHEKLDAAIRVGGRRWDLRLTNGMEIALPEDRRIGEALAGLNFLAAQNLLLDMPIRRIDARNPHRLAILPAAASTSSTKPEEGE